MEIGRKEAYGYHEKQEYARKITIMIVIIILLILVLSSIIIANYTSVFEKALFNNIAKRHGLELSYSNIYELSSADNKEQGNYIQLTDREHGIYILFRYDEDGTEIFNRADNGDQKIYVVNTKHQYSNIIQNEDSILSNIDTEFNKLNTFGTDYNRANIGGGYSILNLDTVLGQHRITYTSNMYSELETRTKHSDLTPNDDKVMPVANWFNYESSESYMIGILKSIVETPSRCDSSSVKLNGGADDVTAYVISTGDETAGIVPEISNVGDNRKEDTRPQTLENTLDVFVDNLDENTNKYEESESYSTYGVIILNVENTTGILNNSVSIGNGTSINGVIIGVCNNDRESIERLTTIVSELVSIQHLERTIIL